MKSIKPLKKKKSPTTYDFEDNLTVAGIPTKQARAIVENEETMIDYKIGKELVTKTDLINETYAIKSDMKDLENSIRSDMKESENSIRSDMKALESRLENKINQVQIEILKAMNMQVWKFYLGLGGLVLLLTLINKFF